jgi:ribosome-binding factor A
MSKGHTRGRAGALPEVDADSFFGSGADRKAERKERQLCRQVKEAIAEALATLEDDVLADVWVMDVAPAPDASRLAVVVQAPQGTPLDLVQERLEKVAGYMRAEVAAAITRKRAPTLAFQVMPEEVTR